MNPKLVLVSLTVLFNSLTVNGQVTEPPVGRQRVCSPHNPLPVDYSLELEECQGEVAAATLLVDPNANKTGEELVKEHGYDFESHTAISQDGYLLTMYRVPGGRRSPKRVGKQAVLLFHGLGAVGDAWLVLPSNKNLVFKLADAGYDVWVANGRGTDLSQGHINLDSTQDVRYWDFSFHEMGVYDLPAMADLILSRTGNEKIFYIGHSQGGTLYLVGASELPELNEKFHASFLLAPAAYVGQHYFKSLDDFVSILYTPLEAQLKNISRGRMDFRRPEDLFGALNVQPNTTCSARAQQCDLCNIPFYNFFDFNPIQTNYTNLPNLAKVLNIFSTKTGIHFGQNMLSCQFRKYDYGTEENLRRYGRTEPPSYNLGSVRTPLHVFYGEQDSQVTPPDIQMLLNDLNPDVVRESHRVGDDSFDHTDFLIARDADILVYDRIISAMNRYGLKMG